MASEHRLRRTRFHTEQRSNGDNTEESVRPARMACEHKRGFAKVCARAPFALIAARVAGWSHARRSAPFRLCVFVAPRESVTSDSSDDSTVGLADSDVVSGLSRTRLHRL